MISPAILTIWLLFVAFVSANFIHLPKRDIILERGASDPCCKSCATIGKVLAECPVQTTDIFCGCDDWVRTAPTCQTCIENVAFNTSFAVNPGPTLETFWTLCQCQSKCRNIANAIFSPTPCNFGQDNLCVSQHLVTDGVKCLPCIKRVDPWMASSFALEIKLAAEFIKTQENAVPGSFPLILLGTNRSCVEVCN